MNFQHIRNEINKERKEKPNLRILLYWAAISVLGIIIIRTFIRPQHYQLSQTCVFLQGTLPNFFAGAMFYVIAFIYYRAFYPNENSLKRRLLFAFLFSFLGLTIWEFIQYLMAYPIDYFDIIMTALGNVLTIIIILLLRIK
jgi:uncharacterized BrkB/YihY/UPF0761 family membrane protein